MDPEKDSFFQCYRWHVIVIVGVVGAVLVFALSRPPDAPSPERGEPGTMYLFVSTFITVILLIVSLVILARISKIIESLADNSSRLEEVTKVLANLGESLHDICRSTQMSETAKAIAFRDTERASLQEAVSKKLNQQDFEAAYQIIDEIAHRSEYRDLALTLRKQADSHRGAIRNERIEQVVVQIEALLNEYQWTKASVQIEGLIKAYPDAERARAMRQRLHEKREEHKKELLSFWDDSVQRQDTDRGLKILKELDHYLTPNEALALQEAAKDAYRTKLHNLGVKFSLAVSDKNWDDALTVGQQIITEFPNSRMGDEIRGKLDVLRENVQLNS